MNESMLDEQFVTTAEEFREAREALIELEKGHLTAQSGR